MAVMECEPTFNFAVLNAAFALVSVTVPRIIVPSLNVTLPVGDPVVEVTTLAVSVTVWP